MNEPTFTVDQVLTRVRLIKLDAAYSISSACLWVYDALMELYEEAPKTRNDPEGAVRNIPNPYTAVTDVVNCSPLYMPLIVDYVVGRAFMEDSNNQEHMTRANAHFELFFKRAHWVQYGPNGFNDRTVMPVQRR